MVQDVISPYIQRMRPGGLCEMGELWKALTIRKSRIVDHEGNRQAQPAAQVRPEDLFAIWLYPCPMKTIEHYL